MIIVIKMNITTEDQTELIQCFDQALKVAFDAIQFLEHYEGKNFIKKSQHING